MHGLVEGYNHIIALKNLYCSIEPIKFYLLLRISRIVIIILKNICKIKIELFFRENKSHTDFTPGKSYINYHHVVEECRPIFMLSYLT